MSLLTKFGSIPSQGGELWLNGWSYGKKITVPASKVDADLTNFPLTVYLNNTNFDFTKAKSDGADIRFTDKNLNQLTFERKEHVYVAGGISFATYNVKLPTVSNTEDTEVYMWYGNASAYNTSIEAWQDQTGKALTYNGNVKLVQSADSYASFDGSGDYFTVPNTSDFNIGTGDYSIEAIINVTKNDSTIIAKYSNGVFSSDGAWSFGTDSNGKLIMAWITNSTTDSVVQSAATIPLNTDTKVAFIRASGVNKLYINDVLDGTRTVGANLELCPFNKITIGRKANATEYGPMQGKILKLRVTKGRARTGVMPTTFTIDGADVVLCTNFDTIYDNNYVMVQHMGDSLGDATGNGNNGTATGTTVVNTDYGKARSFNGTGEFVAVTNATITPALLTSNHTFLIHAKPSNLTQTNKYLWSIRNSASWDTFALLWEYVNDNYEFYSPNATGTDPRTSSQLATPSDDTSVVVYGHNGTEQTKGLNGVVTRISKTFSLPTASFTGHWLGKGFGGNYFGGNIYEVRESSILRSDAWIKAESLSLKDNLCVIENVATKLADIEVTVATTSINITGLNIGKDDEIVLVSEVVNGITTGCDVSLYCNGNVTPTNYYEQTLRADNTSVSASRNNKSVLLYAYTTGSKEIAITNIKLTNSGYFIFQSNQTLAYNQPTNFNLFNYYNTSTFTSTSITQLTITSSVASAIGVGSRFQLYRTGRKI